MERIWEPTDKHTECALARKPFEGLGNAFQCDNAAINKLTVDALWLTLLLRLLFCQLYAMRKIKTRPISDSILASRLLVVRGMWMFSSLCSSRRFAAANCQHDRSNVCQRRGPRRKASQ
jgi:hypothetical protein